MENSKNTKISVMNIVGDQYCIEASDGQKVFELIQKSLSDNRKVTLSFQNITMLTTAFLNSAIGQLYGNFSEEQIRENLKVEDMTKSGKVRLKRVIDTAKLFYKDPEAMKKSIEEILGE